MREIKFRVWDKDRGELVYLTNLELLNTGGFWNREVGEDFEAYNLVLSGEVGRTSQKGHGIVEPYFHNDFNEPVSGFQLMQYIGLKDVNGIEIYEGDIIKDTRNGSIGFYDYSESHTAFAVRVKDEDYTGDFIIIDKLDGWHNINVEVIGNIHENFDLLENPNA